MNSSDLFAVPETYQLIEDISLIIQILGRSNETALHIRTLEDTCGPGQTTQRMLQAALIPAFIIAISFGFTQKRQNFLLNLCNGRPGLAYPMDVFTKNSRVSYSCAFGSTVYLVYKVIFERFYAFEAGGAPYMRPLATVASMLIYGIVYIPIFICITIGTVFGYGVGALYVWLMTAVEIRVISVCNISIEDRLILVAKALPQMICLLYLCVRLPWKCVTACLEKRFAVGSMETQLAGSAVQSLKETYYGQRVMHLLKEPQKESIPEKGLPRLRYSLSKFFSVFYEWDSDFRYSSRLITTQLVGAMVLYQVAFVTIAYVSSLLAMWLRTLRQQKVLADNAYAANPTDDIQRIGDVIEVAIDLIVVFRVLVLVFLLLAALLGLISIFLAFKCYRQFLKDLYKGDHSRITKRGRQVDNPTLLAGCMRYAGYQVGYIAWGFIIQGFVLVVIAAALSVLVALFMQGVTQWLLDALQTAWPVPLIGLVITLSQTLSARYIFLQENGETLSLTNRRIFFTATYFIFFYNIFMGVFSCLMRVLNSLIFGLFLMPRMDHSVLPPSFRFRDPGYQAFVGFLRTESQQCHPVVLTFCHLIEAESIRQTCQITSGGHLDPLYDEHTSSVEMTHFETTSGTATQDKSLTKEQHRKKMVARFQWLLGYTLLQNPSIRLMRKGFVQAQNKARALGMKLPVSDGLLTSDADVIREKTKTFLEQQEKEKEGQQRRLFRRDKRKVGDLENSEVDVTEEKPSSPQDEDDKQSVHSNESINSKQKFLSKSENVDLEVFANKIFVRENDSETSSMGEGIVSKDEVVLRTSL